MAWFMNEAINFLIITFVIFLVVRLANKMQKTIVPAKGGTEYEGMSVLSVGYSAQGEAVCTLHVGSYST